MLSDQIWDNAGERYGKVPGDYNTYRVGRIDRNDVVMVVFAGIGTRSAASATAQLRASYINLRLVVLTGICGGIPLSRGPEMLLGDVVISKEIVGYGSRNYGVPLPPTPELQSFLRVYETRPGLSRLKEQSAYYLRELQVRATTEKYRYPGAATDVLFQPQYRHRHHAPGQCRQCADLKARPCVDSRRMDCDDLQCDRRCAVPRRRVARKQQLERAGDIAAAQTPDIFIGRIASGNSVMKSDMHRDDLARTSGAIALEMEAMGMWDAVPTIVVKGVCDYADSHKNKRWQDFAAATAAAVTKSLIQDYPSTSSRHAGRLERVCRGCESIFWAGLRMALPAPHLRDLFCWGLTTWCWNSARKLAIASGYHILSSSLSASFGTIPVMGFWPRSLFRSMFRYGHDI